MAEYDFVEIAFKSVFFAIIIVGLALLMAWPTKFLINSLFSPGLLLAVFGTSSIGFLKALYINALAGMLFKSTSSSKS